MSDTLPPDGPDGPGGPGGPGDDELPEGAGQEATAAAALADEVCSILMGDDVEVRKHFITSNASDVRFLDV
jgi:hypothetical protein